MLTCVIRYRIDPARPELFTRYARVWDHVVPHCGAELVGFFAPHEGSSSRAFGILKVESLAAYEVYRARLAADPDARANHAFARAERFLLSDERTFVKRVDRDE